MVQHFDVNKLQTVGDAIPLIGHVAGNPVLREGTFSVSENGILVYQSGSTTTSGDELLWLDRAGKQIGKTGTPGEYGTASISPDGSKLAAATLKPNAIWIYDVARGIRTRLAFELAVSGQPEWSPAGFEAREPPCARQIVAKPKLPCANWVAWPGARKAGNVRQRRVQSLFQDQPFLPIANGWLTSRLNWDERKSTWCPSCTAAASG
jgi:WD40 repeat protein